MSDDSINPTFSSPNLSSEPLTIRRKPEYRPVIDSEELPIPLLPSIRTGQRWRGSIVTPPKTVNRMYYHLEALRGVTLEDFYRVDVLEKTFWSKFFLRSHNGVSITVIDTHFPIPIPGFPTTPTNPTKCERVGERVAVVTRQGRFATDVLLRTDIHHDGGGEVMSSGTNISLVETSPLTRSLYWVLW